MARNAGTTQRHGGHPHAPPARPGTAREVEPTFARRCIEALAIPTRALAAPVSLSVYGAPQLAAPLPSRLTELLARHQQRIEVRHRSGADRIAEHAEALCAAAADDTANAEVRPSFFEAIYLLAREEIEDERQRLDVVLGVPAAVFAMAATGVRPYRGVLTAWRVQSGALRAPGLVPAASFWDPYLDAVRPRLLAGLPSLHREMFLTLSGAFPGTANELLVTIHAALADR